MCEDMCPLGQWVDGKCIEFWSEEIQPPWAWILTNKGCLHKKLLQSLYSLVLVGQGQISINAHNCGLPGVDTWFLMHDSSLDMRSEPEMVEIDLSPTTFTTNPHSLKGLRPSPWTAGKFHSLKGTLPPPRTLSDPNRKSTSTITRVVAPKWMRKVSGCTGALHFGLLAGVVTLLALFLPVKEQMVCEWSFYTAASQPDLGQTGTRQTNPPHNSLPNHEAHHSRHPFDHRGPFLGS